VGLSHFISAHGKARLKGFRDILSALIKIKIVIAFLDASCVLRVFDTKISSRLCKWAVVLDLSTYPLDPLNNFD
jgi:hypothetical protein